MEIVIDGLEKQDGSEFEFLEGALRACPLDALSRAARAILDLSEITPAYGVGDVSRTELIGQGLHARLNNNPVLKTSHAKIRDELTFDQAEQAERVPLFRSGLIAVEIDDQPLADPDPYGEHVYPATFVIRPPSYSVMPHHEGKMPKVYFDKGGFISPETVMGLEDDQYETVVSFSGDFDRSRLLRPAIGKGLRAARWPDPTKEERTVCRVGHRDTDPVNIATYMELTYELIEKLTGQTNDSGITAA